MELLDDRSMEGSVEHARSVRMQINRLVKVQKDLVAMEVDNAVSSGKMTEDEKASFRGMYLPLKRFLISNLEKECGLDPSM